jgi:hypothetical protein
MVRRIFGLVAVLASVGACGQLLGIETIHDDPADASVSGDAATPLDGPSREASGGSGNDATVDASADTPPPADAEIDAALPDARTDAAPLDSGPTGAALGCTSADGGPVSFPLNSADLNLAALVIDDGGIYMSDSTGVRRCTLDGCLGGATVVSSTKVFALGADGEHVIWCTNHNVQLADPNGTQTTSFVDWEGCGFLASHGADLYWANQASGGRVIHGVDDPEGGAANQVVSDTYGAAVALAPTSHSLFFMERDGTDASVVDHVVQCDLPSCDAGANVIGTAAPGAFVPALAANEERVFWGDPSSARLLACDVSGCAAGPSVVVGDASVTSVFADEGNVYWTDPNGVYKTPLDGGATKTLASPRGAGHVVANSACVYWTTSGAVEGGQSGVQAVRQP